MKIYLNADSHGEPLKKITGKEDMFFIVGDFAKGNKLRKIVFKNGNIKDAEKEIIKSSKSFLKSLPHKSIIVPGNAEKLCLKKISSMAKNLGHYFLENEIIKINDFKIAGLKFFMEEWWAKETYPEDKDKIRRAKKEELEVKNFLDLNLDIDIILSHSPPNGLLDNDPNAPKYLQDKYPKHGGSKLLLNYIKKNKPKLVVCGHVHVPGEIRVGKTRIINPGKRKIIFI